MVPAYRQICELYPYDPDTQGRLVRAINATYEMSVANLSDHTQLKVDYSLLVLRDLRYFSRLSSLVDANEASRPLSPEEVPRYWYDPSEVPGGATLDELLDILAIEKSWAPGERREVRAPFPAGSMFLVATVEKQATTRGGGVEYIYVPWGDSKVWIECA